MLHGRGRWTSVLRAGSPRRGAALCLHALLALALIPAFALWPGHWHEPGLVALLLVIAILAEPADVRLTNGIRLDGTIAVGVVALVLAGPLAGFVVLFVPVVTSSTLLWRIPVLEVERKALLRAGNLSNLASYGWGMLAAAGALTWTGTHQPVLDAVPAIVLAGCVFEASQLALGPCVHETLWNRYRLGEILRVAVIACWADVAMVVIGALTAVLIAPLGVGALALSATIVMLPGAVPAAVRARPASALAADALAQLYGDALASVLGMPSEERRQVRHALGAVRYLRAHELEQRERLARAGLEPLNVLPPVILRWLKESTGRGDPAAYAAITADECWDGSGATGLRTARAPLLARVIPVAEQWAELTAHGGPELSHEQALAQLAGQAARRYDPHVVDAVAFIIDRERRLSSEPAFQPRAHRLPRALRIPMLRIAAQLSV